MQNFYVTANMVLNLATRAREIFESSEVGEKRQLLNLVFQNLQLRGLNLSVSEQEPFLTMLDCKDHPTNWRWRESNSRPKRTPHRYLHAYHLNFTTYSNVRCPIRSKSAFLSLGNFYKKQNSKSHTK